MNHIVQYFDPKNNKVQYRTKLVGQNISSQLTLSHSKSTIESPEKSVNNVQS